MKTVGIEIISNKAIFVVLEKKSNGTLRLSHESTELCINDPLNNEQVRQFRDQVNLYLDSVAPDEVAILIDSDRPDGVAYKLEGIIQLNTTYAPLIISSSTISSLIKNKPYLLMASVFNSRKKAVSLAYYLLHHRDS